MDRILLATDGSAYAGEALRYAAWLARETGAGILALYVSDLRQFQVPAIADLSGSLGIQPYRDTLDVLRQVEEEKIKYIRTETERLLAKEGVSNWEFETGTGLLVDTIREFEDNVDLIVMGKRGESFEFASEHLGSTMERVLRSSVCPVFVGNRSFHEIRSVAFAYDGGKSCREALRFLKDNPFLRDLSFRLVVAAEDEDETDLAADRIREAESALREAGYEVTGEMLNGVVEDAISRFVVEEDISLLLMGAYGHSRIRRLIIGSTTSEMLLRCRIPVLCFT